MFMLHIQSSLSAAQTQGWNCAAFRSDPIRGKNPFRMTPRSSKSVQKSLRYQHIFANIGYTKIYSYLTHFSIKFDDLRLILKPFKCAADRITPIHGILSTLSLCYIYNHLCLQHEQESGPVPRLGAILSAVRIPSESHQDHPNPLRIH